MNWKNLYFVIDGSSRACIWVTDTPDVAHFLQHNILDTMLFFCDQNTWERMNNASDVKVTHDALNSEWFQSFNNKFTPMNATPNLIKYRKTARIWSKGYNFLLSILDGITTNINQSGFFLTLDDIKLFEDITELAPQLALAESIDIELAKKQLLIEKESLLQIAKQRKLAIWTHSKTLLSITDNESLEVWKNQVRSKSSGVGVI